MYLKLWYACLLLVFSSALQQKEDPLVTFSRREIGTTQSYKPAAGYVPDSATAIAIAMAVFKPVYGEAELVADRPWHAGLKGGVWTIVGTFHGQGDGGTPALQLEKQTGRILFLGHEQ